jgi:uncharacterized Zn finger protein (UPF0148 family)
MPVAKLTCPNCEAVLRPSKPLRPGRKVTCPKCGTRFVVPGDEMDAIAAEPEVPPTPAASGLKKPYEEDDDSGPATYKFVDEPPPLRKRSDIDEYDEDEDEDDDEKFDEREDLSIVPDLTVKDPRGIAQEMLIRPSNYMMLFTVLDFIMVLIIMSWYLIPIFFSIPADSSLNTGPPVQQSKETAKGADAVPLGLLKWVFVLIVSAICIFYLVYDSLIIIGAVRIQHQESYGWGMAGCILGIIPIFGGCPLFYIGRLVASIVTLIALRNPVVVEAYDYKPE